MPAPDALKTFVVVNPASAAGATGRKWGGTAGALEQVLGSSFEYALTEGPGHATQLCRGALERGFEMVVAVGGDGTFNEVARGFFDGTRPVTPGAVLGLLPSGTGVDLPRTFQLDAGGSWLAGQHSIPIDVGHVTFVGRSGQPAERVFLNTSSFGCSGLVVETVARSSKRISGKIPFMIASFRALLRYKDQPVEVSFDDGPAERLTITNLTVCNGRYTGGGMLVAPGASADDGWLDVTIWSGFRLWDFVLKQHTLYSGAHLQDPRTRAQRVRRLSASSSERVLLEIDGDLAGQLPATFQILPGALRLKI
jgi:YegS/Rv2252/BmrU family lipid kinase